MRRIILVLTVALVMTAMTIAGAMPAFAQGGGGGSCKGAACVTAGGGPNYPGGTGTGGGGYVEAYTPTGTTFAAGTAYPPGTACAGAEHENYRAQGGLGISVDTFECHYR